MKRAARCTIGWQKSRRRRLSEAFAQLQAGTAPRIPQDSSAATYAPKLEREHGRIDWNEPAALIERKIRAFNPWPGAFTVLRDEAGARTKTKSLSRQRDRLLQRRPGKPGESHKIRSAETGGGPTRRENAE